MIDLYFGFSRSHRHVCLRDFPNHNEKPSSYNDQNKSTVTQKFEQFQAMTHDLIVFSYVINFAISFSGFLYSGDGNNFTQPMRIKRFDVFLIQLRSYIYLVKCLLVK